LDCDFSTTTSYIAGITGVLHHTQFWFGLVFVCFILRSVLLTYFFA
jgi:hypothetical protein